MKKLLFITAAFISAMSLTACGGNDSSSESSSSKAVTTTEITLTPDEPKPADIEEAVTLSEEAYPLGRDTGLVMNIPSNFTFNDGWSCYSDPDYVGIWLNDASVFKTKDDMDTFLSMKKNVRDEKIGSFTVHMAEETEGFYGASTTYYIEFGKKIGDYECCSVMVSDDNNKKLENTQTDIIKQAIATIAQKP